MSAALCIGVAAGASVGGYIPAAMPDLGAISGTEWNPIFAAFSALVLMLLSYGLFYEGENHDQQPDQNPVAGPLRQTLVQSAQNPFVLELLITMAMAGLALVTVEFFWQPRLRQIVPDISYAVFGWMTAGYFIMGALGSMLIGPLAKALRLSSTVQVRIVPVFYWPPCSPWAGRIARRGLCCFILALCCSTPCFIRRYLLKQTGLHTIRTGQPCKA